MKHKSQLSLEDAIKMFEKWRQTKTHPKERIPAHLWQKAIELAELYPLYRISTALRLNYSSLKERLASRTAVKDSPPQHPSFIELPFPQPSSPSECLIEMENRCGEKIRMHFVGKMSLDLLALSQSFWGRGP